MRETNSVIIGAGPAGITAALYLKRANVPFVWLEKNMPGGKLVNIAEVDNYPGLLHQDGFSLATSLLQSAYDAGASIETSEVVEVIKENDSFLIKTNKDEISTKTVLVATGLANVPSIKGEKEFFGKGVSYCATCDGPLLRKKKAAIYGNGNRVVEESLYLANIVGTLYLLVPSDHLDGELNLVENLKEKNNVEITYNAKVNLIQGDNRVNSISYMDNNGEHSLDISMIFPFAGERSATQFLSSLNVETERNFILVDDSMMTSEPGLFAAGDIVKKRLRQVVTATSDGAIASSGIISYLNKLKKASK